LLLQAAALALEKKKFDVCLDLLDEVDVNVVAADPDIWQRNIDQILKDFVRAALTAKLAELSEKGAARVASPLIKVQSLNLIMRYYTKVNDKEAAQ
jgi:hypothetical protein